MKIDKSRFRANNLREKHSVCLNPNKTQIYFRPRIFNSRDKLFNRTAQNNLS